MAGARRAEGLYSQVVFWLKILFPLLGIVLLSTVFLVQKEDDFDGGLVFSQIDLDSLGDGLTIRNPRFNGATQSGDSFSVVAETALPDGPSPKTIAFTTLHARTNYVSGVSVDVSANAGVAVLATQEIVAEGGVLVETSQGYVGTTDAATANLRTGAMHTHGPIQMKGPLGELEAGRMEIRLLDGAEGSLNRNQFFWFENGVKLVYQASSEHEKDAE